MKVEEILALLTKIKDYFQEFLRKLSRISSKLVWEID